MCSLKIINLKKYMLDGMLAVLKLGRAKVGRIRGLLARQHNYLAVSKLVRNFISKK